MRVRLSSARQGVLGVVGHAGCGHAHSNNGFIQDDSGGLAALLTLFQEAADLPLTIESVGVTAGRNGFFEVRTVSGGVGRCSARRGITLQEGRLARAVEGQEAIRTQTLALDAFGRIYGQGAHEAPVALQTAIANAALDSFVKARPDCFLAADEGLAGNCGRIVGTVLDLDGVAVSAMALSNASEGGIGPNEDLEGNAFVLGKKTVMEPLGLCHLPTLVIEGKVYTPSLCDPLREETFLVRASVDDNPVAGQALMDALDALGYASLYPKEALKRVPGGLEAVTRAAGDAVVVFGERLREARTSTAKVAVLAELIAFASQDAGGLSFMSDRLHEVVGGPGIMPGTSAVLSLLVPQAYIERHVMPYLTEYDVSRYVAVIKKAVGHLRQRLPEAVACLEQRAHSGDLDPFV